MIIIMGRTSNRPGGNGTKGEARLQISHGPAARSTSEWIHGLAQRQEQLLHASVKAGRSYNVFRKSFDVKASKDILAGMTVLCSALGNLVNESRRKA